MATLLELARGQNIPGTKISTLLSPMGVEPVSTKVDSFTPWRAKRKAAITAASQNALSPVNPTEFEDVSDYTESKTGMKADAKRKALLPTVKDGEWTAPGIVHEAAKALSTTGAFFEGVPTTMEDMTNLAGSFGSSSYGLSSFDPKIAGSTLGMFVGPKARNRGKDYNDVKNLSDLLDANVDPLWESLQRPQTNKKLYEQTGWFKGADKKLRTEISDHAAKFNVAEDEVKQLTTKSLDTDHSVRAHMLLVRDLHERVGYGESIDQAKASLAAEIADYDRKLAARGVPSGRTSDQIERAVDRAAGDILNGKTLEEADQALTYYTRYGSSALTGGFTAPLSTVLKHDELFDEYPVLNHVQVRVASNLPPNINGSLTINPHTGLPEIILNGRNKFNDDQLSTLLHEIQHSIQTIEGFDEGTNAQHFMDKYRISRDKAFDRYLQQHGEAEARMTENRRKLTPDERRFLPPYHPSVVEMSTGVKLKDIVIGDAPPKGRKASESAPKLK